MINHNIDLIPMSKMIWKETFSMILVRICFTKSDRVNWFVDWVNWTNADDCNMILFVVVIKRFETNEAK